MTPARRTASTWFSRLRESTLTMAAVVGAASALLTMGLNSAVRVKAVGALPARVDSISLSYVNRQAYDSLAARVGGLEEGQRKILTRLDAIHRQQLYGDCKAGGDTLPDICARRHLAPDLTR
ncbi:MAG TPA: hypothetical protein VF746_13305 [Longimicrobium sp.]|jgi:hypothetical protein